MRILFVSGEASDIPLALQLSKHGHMVVFYSSNPYVSGQALNYSRKIHRGLSRAEFVKMCSDGFFSLVKEPRPFDADEVWVCVNTIRKGADTFAEAENLTKTAASMTRRLEKFVLCGLTRPGDAKLLIKTFQQHNPYHPNGLYYVGACQTSFSKTPCWSNIGEENAPETIKLLKPIFFKTVESAEAANLTALASEAVRRLATLHLSEFFKSGELLRPLVGDDEVLAEKQVDALRYAGSVVKNTSYNFLANAYRSLVKDSSWRKRAIMREVVKLSRSGGKLVSIAVVCPDDRKEEVRMMFEGKPVKTVCVDEEELEARGAGLLKGFAGVVVASNRLDLAAEVQENFKTAWFLPLV
ncbi:MAG: hypothetical protein QXV14_06905 [Candidatus Caldarchaeum sp.]